MTATLILPPIRQAHIPKGERFSNANISMMIPSLIKSKKLFEKRRQVMPAPSTSCPALSMVSESDGTADTTHCSCDYCRSCSIPIPKSHIHRTPSELQLADEMRRAEYDDVRMYTRLLAGMQHQLQRDFRANGGVVHPLSKKSLQGIVKTKHATYDEIDGELSYTEDEENRAVQHLPWSTRLVRDGLPLSQSSSDCSLSTLDSVDIQDEQDEGMFVFDLEL